MNVEEVQPLEHHQLLLKFDDAFEGVADLTEVIFGTLFAPLSDENYFREAYVDGDGNISWPDGAYLEAEALWHLAQGK